MTVGKMMSKLTKLERLTLNYMKKRKKTLFDDVFLKLTPNDIYVDRLQRFFSWLDKRGLIRKKEELEVMDMIDMSKMNDRSMYNKSSDLPAFHFTEEDKKKKDSVDAKNHLENSIYQAEKMPDEYKDKISDEDKDTIKKAVEAAKKVLNDEKSDKDSYEAAMKELNDQIMPIGAKMYQQASADSQEDAKKDSDQQDDDAVEGEVVDK